MNEDGGCSWRAVSNRLIKLFRAMMVMLHDKYWNPLNWSPLDWGGEVGGGGERYVRYEGDEEEEGSYDVSSSRSMLRPNKMYLNQTCPGRLFAMKVDGWAPSHPPLWQRAHLGHLCMRYIFIGRST